jgi:hypothetical protein
MPELIVVSMGCADHVRARDVSYPKRAGEILPNSEIEINWLALRTTLIATHPNQVNFTVFMGAFLYQRSIEATFRMARITSHRSDIDRPMGAEGPEDGSLTPSHGV